MLRWRVLQAAMRAVCVAPTAFRTIHPCFGLLAWSLSPGRRADVEDNLRHLLPAAPPERIVREGRAVFRSIARYYVEFMALPTETAAQVHDRLDVYGFENVEAARSIGRGAIIAGIHHGPAEIVLQAFAARQVLYTAMVERLRSQQIASLMAEIRSGYGQTYVNADMAGTRALLRTLRRGGVVAVLIDRDVRGTGAPVHFCGGTIQAPTGAVELSRATGAPIVPALASWRGARRMATSLLEPLGPPARGGGHEAAVRATEHLLEQFEPHLRRLPGQWLVMDRLFR